MHVQTCPRHISSQKMQVRWSSISKLPSRLCTVACQPHLAQLGRDEPGSSQRSNVAGTSTAEQPMQKPARAVNLPGHLKSNFCRLCGSSMQIKVPEGDASPRHVCSSCFYVDYFNPKMVVGAIVEHQGKVLLCRRGIEPCKGLWTLPAGYMELSESSADGAARETWEEANARVKIVAPYAHYDIPVIGQAYILFRATLEPPFTFSPGQESLETQLFAPYEIPYDKLAFSSVAITLRLWVEDMQAGVFRVHHGTIDRQPGASPNDPATFQLRDHFALQTVAEQINL